MITGLWEKIEAAAIELDAQRWENGQNKIKALELELEALKQKAIVTVTTHNDYGLPIIRMETITPDPEEQEIAAKTEEARRKVSLSKDPSAEDRKYHAERLKRCNITPLAILPREFFDLLCQQFGLFRFEDLERGGVIWLSKTHDHLEERLRELIYPDDTDASTPPQRNNVPVNVYFTSNPTQHLAETIHKMQDPKEYTARFDQPMFAVMPGWVELIPGERQSAPKSVLGRLAKMPEPIVYSSTRNTIAILHAPDEDFAPEAEVIRWAKEECLRQLDHD